MNADVARRATPAAYAGSRTWADRLLAAVPLLSIFVWLAIVYVWESWDHLTPWLFTDELELTQIARSLAATGHPARRGDPYSIHSLYTVLTAPAWWLPTTQQAYAAVKYIGVFGMTLSVFPAYFLARLFVPPRASLFAAVATGAIPALVYSSFIVEEPFAYSWATLCLFLIAKAFMTSRRPWIAAAAVASIAAPAFRDELIVVPIVYAVAALLMLWSSEPMLRRRAEWRGADLTGVALLAVGAAIVVGAVASSASLQYLLMTRYYHGWILSHALKAGGALVIGIGILPLVATCGVLLRAPGEERSRALRVFRSLTVATVLLVGLYTGVKGSYNQYSFATRVWERNMIYIAPLLFVGTAIWVDRRRLNVWATLGGAALAAYLLAKTPYLIEFHFSSDTPGVAILAQANRLLAWTTTDCRIALYAVLAASVGVLLAPQLLPRASRRHVATAVVAFAAVFVVAWNVTAEISAADAANSVSRTFMANIGSGPTWLDRDTHGARTLYLGQQMTDQNSEWLLEFWNRSLQEVWSLDGTAQGPGRVQTPDLKPDGELIGKPPSTARYIVVETGIDPDGTLVAKRSHAAGGGREPWRLYRINPPLRLLGAVTGLYADHWSSDRQSAYTRYAKGLGTMKLTVSRREWGGPDKPGHVTIRMGTLTIGVDRQPHIGRVTRTIRYVVHSNEAKTFTIPTPASRFRVEVSVTPTFSPHELVPQLGDNRQLGAVLTYKFVPRKAAQR